MSEENVHDILERVSTDKSFREQFVIALGSKLKDDDDLRQKLLDAPSAVPKKDKESIGLRARFTNLNVNMERILQLFLSGILVALFVVIAVLTLVRIDAAPQSVLMGDKMEMYDPFVRINSTYSIIHHNSKLLARLLYPGKKG